MSQSQQAYSTESNAIAKKNKKKKGKGKTVNPAINGISEAVTDEGTGLSFDDDLDDSEGLPIHDPLDSFGDMTASLPNPLSSVFPGSYEPDPRSVPYPSLNLTHQDLLNTANELYRRMEDPQFGTDDAYWTSLPVHLRNFIRNALPLAGNVSGLGGIGAGSIPSFPNNGVGNGQRAMYAMAQQIVSAANQGMGLGQGVGNSMLAGMGGSFAGMNGSVNGLNNPLSNGGKTISSSSIKEEPPLSLAKEFGFYPHPDHHEPQMPGAMPFSGTGQRRGGGPQRGAVVDTADDEYESDGALDSGDSANALQNPSQGGDAGKKKKNKKKKKGGNDAVMPSLVPAPPIVTPVPPKPAPASVQRAQQPPAPTQAQPPAQARPPPPANVQPPPAKQTPAIPTSTPQSQQPPPSTRAAGKQPMTNSLPAGNVNPPPQNQPAAQPVPARSARSAGKAPLTAAPPAHTHPHPPGHNHTGHNHPPPAASKPNATATGSKAKPAAPAAPARIWQTSSSEERERIKEFWLSLGQDDRQSLVKVEKDAVLRKMKEQQRHSCGCAVCGRKRSAIEDELEVLYDAYYDELEAYAHHQAQYSTAAGAISAPLGPGPFPGSVEVDGQGQVIRPDHLAPRRPTQNHDSHRHHRADTVESDEEYDDDDDDYDDDEGADDEDEGGSDEADNGDDDDEDARTRNSAKKLPVAKSNQPVPVKPVDSANSEAGDFFSFGSSLTTVKGGILTVADDLLKNDGQKFLEMMEQLATRRTAREDAAIQAMEDEDEDEEEDEEDDGDEDIDDDEDDEDDEDEEDAALTDTQRMEEGRRMFQIFAARMFEQRVLQAYREKVAQEKQLQFLRELEEEENAAEAREARKAKDAQKKKDKKKQQKQAKEDEKAKREAAIAAEVAAARSKQEAAEREAAKRREEEKLRREVEKKAKMEEAAKKEEEKRKRQAEEREREAEQQRKKKEKEDRLKAEREAKEKERKEKEEKDRQSREMKEKEDREHKERLVLEAEARKETARKEKEAKEEREKESQAQALAQAQARLLSQQRAAAAKSAAIALQQAKAQKAVRPVPVAASRAKPAARPPVASGSKPQAPAAVGLASPPNIVSVMPSANIRPPPARSTPPTQPATPLVAPQQVAPHQIYAANGSSSMIGSQPAYPITRPLNAPSPALAPQMVNLASSSSSAGQQNPFPTQMPGFSSRQSSGLTPTGFGGMPAYGQMTLEPSPVFGQAVLGQGSSAVSPGPSRGLAFGSEPGPSAMDGHVGGGIGSSSMRSVGLGHPGKPLMRSTDDTLYSAAIATPNALPRQTSDQDMSAAQISSASDYRHVIGRPDPIGPIEPIGRPRLNGPDVFDEPVISAPTSRRSSPPGVDKVLGSAALLAGDDDEVIVPAPRRVSNTAALGASWGGSAIGGGSQWGASPFGVSASPGIWGGGGGGQSTSNNWPTSNSNYGPAARFDAQKTFEPIKAGTPLGAVNQQPIGRGFGGGGPLPGMGLGGFQQSNSMFGSTQQPNQSQHH